MPGKSQCWEVQVPGDPSVEESQCQVRTQCWEIPVPGECQCRGVPHIRRPPPQPHVPDVPHPAPPAQFPPHGHAASPAKLHFNGLRNTDLVEKELANSPQQGEDPTCLPQPPGRRTGGAARRSPISHLIPIPVPPPSRGISGHRSGSLMPSHSGRDGSADVGLTTATAEPCGGPRALQEPGSSRPHPPRGPALQPQSRGPGSLQSTEGSRTISGIKPPQ